MEKPKWSYLYAYNIRVIRDIFVYCSRGNIKEKDLYKAMEDFKIPPPKEKWITPNKKKKERLCLEYIHAAEYLGFIKRINGLVKPNMEEFNGEKEAILTENKERKFNPSTVSPPLTSREKSSFLTIILSYERARDFLRWFLDFSKFPTIWSFSLDDFKREAKPILLEKIRPGEKGSKILKREIDNKIWKIPEDYMRLASFVFPAWFKELEIIDGLIVFPEFSEDKKLWYLYYPIKMAEEEFLKLNIVELLESLFYKRGIKNVWIPYLLYVIAHNYYCPVKAIKKSIETAYDKRLEYFYLERAPLHLIKKRHKESYIKIGGFYRSYLNFIKGRSHGK